MPPFLLPPAPITSLDEYLATDVGGLGVKTAQDIGPAATIGAIDAAGLRGRGGAGFPTGRKWSAVAGRIGPASTTVTSEIAANRTGNDKERPRFARMRALPNSSGPEDVKPI